MATDSPDFQLTIKVNTVPTADNPDWQITATGPGGTPIGGYASLTGPGEAVTPGDLTQAGGLAVNSGASGIFLQADGGADIQIQTDPLGAGATVIESGPGVTKFIAGATFETDVTFAGGAFVAGEVLTVTNVAGPLTTATFEPPAAPVGGYASLTGAGTTATPGDLVQAGGFTVDEAGATGVVVNDSGTGGIDLNESGTLGINLTDTGTGGIGVVENGIGNGMTFEVQNAANAGGVTLSDFGTGGVNVQQNPAGLLGFYGVAPIDQPAAPVTLGDVIAVLHNLGLTA
jgi:hypothetical protein